ncbi:MAG TPA: outer membrane protein assembly factor BamE [Tepidisphaeraceae bacterium]|nr:outer membrane protein assembly factor BamE [Tepidisphaeraceae bacterium]
MRDQLGFLILIACLIATTGCLFTADSQKTTSGNSVAEGTFSQITLGKTTVGWVKATLGEPTRRSQADDHEVWEYSYTERTDSSGSVFLIFGGHNSTQTTHKAYVEFKDGVVVNKWRA